MENDKEKLAPAEPQPDAQVDPMEEIYHMARKYFREAVVPGQAFKKFVREQLQAAEQHATRAAGEKLKKVLTEHWLFSVHCDHKKETDIATCACGWTGKTEPTVGFAVEGWVNHVLAKSAAPPLTAFKALADALKFYADPNTYFAIGIFPDKPCGDFMDDFSETELGSKPGKRARAAIAEAEKGAP